MPLTPALDDRAARRKPGAGAAVPHLDDKPLVKARDNTERIILQAKVLEVKRRTQGSFLANGVI